MSLLLASDVASQLGETGRAADYLKTAKEMLLYVGRTCQVADALGLIAAPAEGVGTGEYDLVNGRALALTCWARFVFHGWDMYSDAY